MGGDYNVNTQYLYRADGSKLRKTYTFGFGPTNTQTSTQTDYLDGFQYEATSRTGKFTMVLKFVPTAEGYYDFEKNKYIYSYTDHLGNIRLSYFRNGNNSAEVLEENNFYPFGLKHEGYNTQAGNPSYTYQYNGKELQKETGWSDYGARMYMSDIGRWGVIDPLSETSRRFTPYNYAYNNPIRFIDPDGRKAESPDAIEKNIIRKNAPDGSLWFTYANGEHGAGGGDGMGDFFYQMEKYSGGGGNSASAEDNINSFVRNGVSYEVAVKVSQNGAISFDDYASSGNYFQGIDFSKNGNINDEDPVNFFGKSDKAVFHKKFKEMNNLLKNTDGDGIFRVYGHGNLDMLWNEDERIFNAKDFDKAMSAKNSNWKNVDKYKRPILIIFACLSATDVGDNGSMAKQISKAHPGLMVIGFRGFVEYDLSVKGIQKVNRQQNAGDGNGLIVFYRNGKALSGYYYREFLKKYTNFK